MKKMLMPILEIIVLFLVTAFVTRPAYAEVQIPDGLYPNVGIVTEMTERQIIGDVTIWEITVTDSEGRAWCYLDDAKDIYLGDMIALMMLDEYQTSDDPSDDLVVDARVSKFQ